MTPVRALDVEATPADVSAARPHLWPAFAKGHGTGNDFLVLLDTSTDDLGTSTDDLPEDLVRALCDRRTGIGADGILRVLPAADGWIMDHRNADGSVSQMCGNGVRVVGRYLVETGLAAPGPIMIHARGRTVALEVPADPEAGITVDMGPAHPSGIEVGVLLPRAGHPSEEPVALRGQAVWCPNPHAVVWCETDPADLGDIEGSTLTPEGRTTFPDGANIEFCQRLEADRVRMRINERGVGETRACGTGACAVAACQMALSGATSVHVEQPGGTVEVSRSPSGTLLLRGPAVIVAHGRLTDRWCVDARAPR